MPAVLAWAVKTVVAAKTEAARIVVELGGLAALGTAGPLRGFERRREDCWQTALRGVEMQREGCW